MKGNLYSLLMDPNVFHLVFHSMEVNIQIQFPMSCKRLSVVTRNKTPHLSSSLSSKSQNYQFMLSRNRTTSRNVSLFLEISCHAKCRVVAWLLAFFLGVIGAPHILIADQATSTLLGVRKTSQCHFRLTFRLRHTNTHVAPFSTIEQSCYCLEL